jgi:hypothetical protein
VKVVLFVGEFGTPLSMATLDRDFIPVPWQAWTDHA